MQISHPIHTTTSLYHYLVVIQRYSCIHAAELGSACSTYCTSAITASKKSSVLTSAAPTATLICLDAVRVPRPKHPGLHDGGDAALACGLRCLQEQLERYLRVRGGLDRHDVNHKLEHLPGARGENSSDLSPSPAATACSCTNSAKLRAANTN